MLAHHRKMNISSLRKLKTESIKFRNIDLEFSFDIFCKYNRLNSFAARVLFVIWYCYLVLLFVCDYVAPVEKFVNINEAISNN